MIGITSYGGYIPRLRLDRMAIYQGMGLVCAGHHRRGPGGEIFLQLGRRQSDHGRGRGPGLFKRNR